MLLLVCLARSAGLRGGRQRAKTYEDAEVSDPRVVELRLILRGFVQPRAKAD